MDHDVIVIGGSFAGLSAAMYLARARRTVLVLDTGLPRNRFSEASHGFLGQDGDAPAQMLTRARARVARYPTVTFKAREAAHAAAIPGGFAVTQGGGEVRTARLLVLAMGITDLLPELPGIIPRWGRSVLHCPYCHGFEHAGRPLGVLQASPNSIHQALLVAEWGPVTFFTNGAEGPDEEGMRALQEKGITVEERPISALEGEETALSAARFTDGATRPLEALFVAPGIRLNGGAILEELGCAIEETPMGPMVRTDAWKETSVPGVFAAGDLARTPHSVTWASADGVSAGVAAHRALVFGGADG